MTMLGHYIFRSMRKLQECFCHSTKPRRSSYQKLAHLLRIQRVPGLFLAAGLAILTEDVRGDISGSLGGHSEHYCLL